jgi:hypothetical protein
LEKAPDLVVDSVANWVDGMKPVVEPESHFLDDRHDLVSLSGEHSSKELLENYLERRWYRLFITKVCLNLDPETFAYCLQQLGAQITAAVKPQCGILFS